VVIGTSAGGVEALSRLVGALPADFPAAVFAVIHIPETATSMLPRILGRSGAMKAVHAADGAVPEPGTVYAAPPGKHMLLRGGKIRLVSGPRENGHRPAIDPLFRTAARCFGSRVAGVVLTGMLDDGTVGMAWVKRFGGVTVAQDPEDAMFPDMPRNAIEHTDVDYVLPLDRIAPMLCELAAGKKEYVGVCEMEDEMEPDPTEMSMDQLMEFEARGVPSELTCPECHGALYQLSESGVTNYRCRVGHAYTGETLDAHQSLHVEGALWTALRALEESTNLLVRLRDRALSQGHGITAKRFGSRIQETMQKVELLRSVLGVAQAHLPVGDARPGHVSAQDRP
jgi:two-component system chemotaxis response regulator CheB